ITDLSRCPISASVYCRHFCVFSQLYRITRTDPDLEYMDVSCEFLRPAGCTLENVTADDLSEYEQDHQNQCGNQKTFFKSVKIFFHIASPYFVTCLLCFLNCFIEFFEKFGSEHFFIFLVNRFSFFTERLPLFI